MTRDQIKAILFEEIGNIAPEADLLSLHPDADLREEIDIDSIGFLNLIIALGKRIGVNVPEKDYARLDTITRALDYLASASGRAGAE